MRISLREPLQNPLSLPATRLLSDRKDYLFHNDQYGLRHPLAIYNVSIATVLGRNETLIDCLEIIHRSNKDPLGDKATVERLIAATDHFLDAVMEHIDDCVNVIKCLFPKNQKSERAKECQAFLKGIRDFREGIAKQVNFIKHNQSRIRLMAFYSDGYVIPGYFIEGVLPGGVLGPHPEIHEDSNTAFSYSRVMRLFMCGLFFSSKHLEQVLQTHLGRAKNDQIENDEKLCRAIDRIGAYQRVFFPDEYGKPVPMVEVNKAMRMVEYPAKKVHLVSFPRHGRIIGSYVGDGVTRSFKLPYWSAGDR